MTASTEDATLGALNGEFHNGGWLRFDGSRLAEERGTCYIELGCHDLAESALADALGQKLSPRRRGSVLTDLAALGVQRRDVDQLLEYGEAAGGDAWPDGPTVDAGDSAQHSRSGGPALLSSRRRADTLHVLDHAAGRAPLGVHGVVGVGSL